MASAVEEPGRDAASPHAVTRDERGSVWVLTWDRQSRRNALDPASLQLVAEHLVAAAARPDVRACVLTGAGDVAFSSGMDLGALASDREAAGRAVGAWTTAVEDPERVVLIAAVNGMAMGGGFEIAMRCDLVVAAAHATFGLPEVTRGIVPRGGALGLPAAIPVQAAMELALTGDHVPAARIHELGLVNRIVPGAEVVDAAVALGQRIAEHPPEAVSEIRRALWAAVGSPGR